MGPEITQQRKEEKIKMTEDTRTKEDPVLSEDDIEIGCIVHSNNHMDYVVEVYRERDRDRAPKKHEYSFGHPVYTHQRVEGQDYVVFGVVYDTQILDPDQGRAGPRLAAERQDMFTPGYVQDKQTILGVALLGYAKVSESPDDSDGGWDIEEVSHEMPPWTLDVDMMVREVNDDAFLRLHTVDGDLELGYYQRLLSVADSFGAEVSLSILERLRRVTGPDVNEMLDVLERNIRWQSTTDRGVVR
jgi:hypothetical protein